MSVESNQCFNKIFHLNIGLKLSTTYWAIGFLFQIGVIIVWWLDLQLPMQSVSITTKVVSLNPRSGEVYSMQHYVIKFVSDLLQVGGFLHVLWFPPPIKLTATI